MTPTGGKTTVSMRYLRHFNTVYLEPFSPHSLQRIFENILDWYFMNNDLKKMITALKTPIVESTI